MDGSERFSGKNKGFFPYVAPEISSPTEEAVHGTRMTIPSLFMAQEQLAKSEADLLMLQQWQHAMG